MWARVVEMMLGCWLAISPFVFNHGDASVLWAMDFLFASTVIVLALLSYWQPARHAHLGIVVVATIFVFLTLRYRAVKTRYRRERNASSP